jgi:hypothetical protein
MHILLKVRIFKSTIIVNSNETLLNIKNNEVKITIIVQKKLINCALIQKSER